MTDSTMEHRLAYARHVGKLHGLITALEIGVQYNDAAGIRNVVKEMVASRDEFDALIERLSVDRDTIVELQQ